MLLHCFGCSLHWWDRMVPLLARRHRVIRIDLLGFGGSEKPKSGYSMEDQGRLVALALGKLQVQGAVVVGHSMGFDVATALAGESSELVDRLVDIDDAPDPSFGDLPFTARLDLHPGDRAGAAADRPRLRDRGRLRVGLRPRLRPGRLLGPGHRRLQGDDLYLVRPLARRGGRLRGRAAPRPAGPQRRRAAAGDLRRSTTSSTTTRRAAAQAYGDVPGARITILPGAGHSPNVEKPAETSRLVLDFAARRAPSSTALAQLPIASDPPPSPTPAGGRRRRSGRGSGARRGGGRAGHGPRRARCRTASS